jgi:hypothetical protein
VNTGIENRRVTLVIDHVAVAMDRVAMREGYQRPPAR